MNGELVFTLSIHLANGIFNKNREAWRGRFVETATLLGRYSEKSNLRNLLILGSGSTSLNIIIQKTHYILYLLF